MLQSVLAMNTSRLGSIGSLAGIAAGLIAWRVYRVRRVRYKRIQELEAKYKHLQGNMYAMNYQEATEIMALMTLWDFPWLTLISLSFALFQTYAIPTISKVLVKSKELGTSETAARRAEDTAVLLSEFIMEGLDSERGSVCLARMNYLHARHGSAIRNDDLLYTLSLFTFEPIELIDKYEYRKLTELERMSRLIFWQEVGARMGITGIPRTYEDFWDWKEEYAKKAMVYADTNQQTGEVTMEVFLRPFPNFMKPFARQGAMVLVPEIVREAFGWPRATPEALYWIVPSLLRLRAAFIRNFMFPRTKLPPWYDREVHPDGHITRNGFVFEPWYVSKGASSLGELGLGEPGPRFRCEGYKVESLGPERLLNVGLKETMDAASDIRKRAAVCPFF